jgi:hypothetical protein
MINLLVVLLSSAGALTWEMLFCVLPAKRALLADANCSLVWIYLSVIPYVASVGYEITTYAWIDSIGAIGIAAFLLLREQKLSANRRAVLLATARIKVIICLVLCMISFPVRMLDGLRIILKKRRPRPGRSHQEKHVNLRACSTCLRGNVLLPICILAEDQCIGYRNGTSSQTDDIPIARNLAGIPSRSTLLPPQAKIMVTFFRNASLMHPSLSRDRACRLRGRAC